MKAMACGDASAAPVLAPLPLAAIVPDGEKSVSVNAPDLSLDGRSPPPDPDRPEPPTSADRRLSLSRPGRTSERAFTA
ncbi:hypothetical protein I6F07_09135 [Ensifer sp. IC4062]|nr:hypothetical protein [Ensifer sp. IC4062]MCA1440373.1 hypothetical protein [Ensifer sp. IC4062]